MHRKIVSDIVRGQTLVSLPPGTTVHEAARTMSERHIGAVLIALEGRLQGIFTERDVLTRIVAPGLDSGETVLGSVMTPNPDPVGPGDTALEAPQRMSERPRGRSPARGQRRVDEPARPTIVRR